MNLEEIHAEPHRIDALIAAGEDIEFLDGCQPVARLIPRPSYSQARQTGAVKGWTPEHLETHRKRIDEIWGDEQIMTTEESAAMLHRIRKQTNG
jgi:antitoxin (DNA-binding transcriptional repressor) of toxin-antitoxin stability system